MTDFREKFWVSGKIIAFICFFESSLKVALSITDLVFGHFRNAVPSETRSLCKGFVEHLNIVLTVSGFSFHPFNHLCRHRIAGNSLLHLALDRINEEGDRKGSLLDLPCRNRNLPSIFLLLRNNFDPRSLRGAQFFHHDGWNRSHCLDRHGNLFHQVHHFTLSRDVRTRDRNGSTFDLACSNH